MEQGGRFFVWRKKFWKTSPGGGDLTHRLPMRRVNCSAIRPWGEEELQKMVKGFRTRVDQETGG